MDQKIAIIIYNYLEYLQAKKVPFVKAYLLGSYAKSKETVLSDIDIALIFNAENIPDRFDLQVQLVSLATDIDTRIEPHPINNDDFNAENPLAYEILTTGKQISLSSREL
jgi:predicted nucleotidyltransferase